MPFALVTIGLLMIVTGAKGTHKCFGADVAEDFTGKNNFLYWLVAIGVVGSIGYSATWREFSTAFLTLILVAMVIRNGGVFDQLTVAISQPPVNTCKPTTGTGNSAAPSRGTITIEPTQRGAFGQNPESTGQAKFNGWLNSIMGAN